MKALKDLRTFPHGFQNIPPQVPALIPAMHPLYHLDDPATVCSPSLVIFRDLVEENLNRILQIAGEVSRLRPHAKTHKMPDVVRMESRRGILKHKCATLAEAEMLAECGIQDILLAYNLVGPNIQRAVEFRQRFPSVRLIATVDHPRPLEELGRAMFAAGTTLDLLLDVDTGQHRTGLPVGPAAEDLYARMASTPGVVPAGLHVYDGHQHQKERQDREAAVLAAFRPVQEFRDLLVRRGFAVPRLVCGGTASFPIYAAQSDPSIELSPGTCLFHDAGYADSFPDLPFVPAACILTRVISRPTPDRVTFDLGYKAIASDPPAGRRLVFPEIPDAEQVLQNEEHLVITTQQAEQFQPGDIAWAIPRHICPSVALHKQAFIAVQGKIVESWDVTARDRQLTL